MIPTHHLRHGLTSDLAAALSTQRELTNEQLTAALANALDRIATLENEWEEVGRAFAWFNQEMDKSRTRG